jgi:hypothetical protein
MPIAPRQRWRCCLSRRGRSCVEPAFLPLDHRARSALQYDGDAGLDLGASPLGQPSGAGTSALPSGDARCGQAARVAVVWRRTCRSADAARRRRRRWPRRTRRRRCAGSVRVRGSPAWPGPLEALVELLERDRGVAVAGHQITATPRRPRAASPTGRGSPRSGCSRPAMTTGPSHGCGSQSRTTSTGRPQHRLPVIRMRDRAVAVAVHRCSFLARWGAWWVSGWPAA